MRMVRLQPSVRRAINGHLVSDVSILTSVIAAGI